MPQNEILVAILDLAAILDFLKLAITSSFFIGLMPNFKLKSDILLGIRDIRD